MLELFQSDKVYWPDGKIVNDMDASCANNNAENTVIHINKIFLKNFIK